MKEAKSGSVFQSLFSLSAVLFGLVKRGSIPTILNVDCVGRVTHFGLPWPWALLMIIAPVLIFALF